MTEQTPPQSTDEKDLSAEAVRAVLGLLATLHQTWEREPAAAEPEATLPVRYRKGTPLHWEPIPRAEHS